MKRVFVSVAMVGLLAGCGVLDRGRGPTTPTLGERTAVLERAKEELREDLAKAAAFVADPPRRAHRRATTRTRRRAPAAI